MNSDPPRQITVLSLAALLGLGACADFSRGEPRPDGSVGDATLGEAGEAGGGTSFARTVHPLLLSGCRGCHAQGQQAGDTQLKLTGSAADDYQTVLPLVDTGSPAASRLLSKMSGHGHGGGTVFGEGTPEYETVLTWIQEGAAP